MEALQDWPAPHAAYEVAGRLLFIQCENSRLARLIEQLFAGWLFTPVRCSARLPDINIRFYCLERLPEIPRGLDRFEIAQGRRCFSDGEAYYLEFNNSLVFVKNGEVVDVVLWIEEIPESPDAGLARATSSAVCAALRRCGLFELHAAGVVDPDSGKGALIVGPSGSGKSTITLQLAQAAWRYLSDDELLLSLVDGEVEARGFRGFFAISKTTAVASGIAGLENFWPQDSSGFKTRFEPAGLFPNAQTSRVLPGLLFFTALSGEGESRLCELTQAETMARLIRACPWATYDRATAGPNLDLLSRLARQTRGFNLEAGRDLLLPGRASALLKPYTRLS